MLDVLAIGLVAKGNAKKATEKGHPKNKMVGATIGLGLGLELLGGIIGIAAGAEAAAVLLGLVGLIIGLVISRSMTNNLPKLGGHPSENSDTMVECPQCKLSINREMHSTCVSCGTELPAV